MDKNVREFLVKISRGPCLRQFNGDGCICFACEARDLLLRDNEAIARAEGK